MKKYRVIGGIIGTSLVLVLGGWLLMRGVHFDILQPSGAVAVKQRNLLLLALGLMAIVVVPVFVMLGLFAWKYREGAKAEHKPEWSENHKLELIWWGLPILVIGSLAVVTWFTSHSLDPYRPIESDKKVIEVQVVALQWKWLFIYPDLGVATINQLPIPVDTPVHFTMTADAPMNAFWIPALGSQMYTMNGMSSQLNLIADKVGDYNGVTSNISGKGYADMTFKVQARPDAEFRKTIDEMKHSRAMMDEATYETLIAPNTMEPQAYMLMDKDLYQKIVEKYMGHSMPHDSKMHMMEDM